MKNRHQVVENGRKGRSMSAVFMRRNFVMQKGPKTAAQSFNPNRTDFTLSLA
jgi:hypothetical protein